MDGEDVPRYKCGSLAENKVRVKGIYHDKISVQGKAGQDPKCQSFQQHHLPAMSYTGKTWATTKKENRDW